MQRQIGLEVAATAGIYAATTAATGTEWTQLGDVACRQVILYNDSGTTLDVSYCTPAGAAIAGQDSLQVANGVAQPLRGIANANQVRIKRNDESNIQVTIKFVAEGTAAGA